MNHYFKSIDNCHGHP